MITGQLSVNGVGSVLSWGKGLRRFIFSIVRDRSVSSGPTKSATVAGRSGGKRQKMSTRNSKVHPSPLRRGGRALEEETMGEAGLESLSKIEGRGSF